MTAPITRSREKRRELSWFGAKPVVIRICHCREFSCRRACTILFRLAATHRFKPAQTASFRGIGSVMRACPLPPPSFPPIHTPLRAPKPFPNQISRDKDRAAAPAVHSARSAHVAPLHSQLRCCCCCCCTQAECESHNSSGCC
jgi:hypothetical protein